VHASRRLRHLPFIGHQVSELHQYRHEQESIADTHHLSTQIQAGRSMFSMGALMVDVELNSASITSYIGMYG